MGEPVTPLEIEIAVTRTGQGGAQAEADLKGVTAAQEKATVGTILNTDNSVFDYSALTP